MIKRLILILLVVLISTTVDANIWLKYKNYDYTLQTYYLVSPQGVVWLWTCRTLGNGRETCKFMRVS